MTWRAGLALYALALAAGSLGPVTADAVAVSDKIAHCLGYAVFALLARQGFPLLPAVLIPLGFGVLMELLQTQVPGRDGSLGDVAANALGVALGLLCAGLVRRIRPLSLRSENA